MVIKMKNKRGWIRIVEAFVAILLITGVLLFVINRGYMGKKDITSEVYDIQINILRNIELNTELRQEILEAVYNQQNPENPNLPITWDIDFPQKTKDKINTYFLDYDYLECKAKLCELDKICTLENLPEEKDVYAQSVVISSTLEKYSPSQLKLFCWLRD